MNAIIQHSVLIVSGTQKGAAYITELLSPREFAPMTTALSGGDARRLLLRRSYDLVVINTPLPDEFGHELAEYVTDFSVDMSQAKSEGVVRFSITINKRGKEETQACTVTLRNGLDIAGQRAVLSGASPAYRHAEPLAAL